MKGFCWAIFHTILTLMGDKDYLLNGRYYGKYRNRKDIIKAIWRLRKSA